MAAHAKLAPSAAHRWLNCPGSIRLTADIPETTSKYAEEGTAAHKVAEYCLNTKHDVSDMAVESFMSILRLNDLLDKEELPFIQVYLDTIRADRALYPDAEFRAEQRVRLDQYVPDLFGTVDAQLGEYLGTLRVYDLKFGRGVLVEPEGNPQQMIYALGAIGKDNLNEYQDVELVIIQPRAPHNEGPVRRWRTTVEYLQRWADEVLVPLANLTRDPNAPVSAGDWCRFCPALGQCPVAAKKAAESAMQEFDAVVQAEPANIVLPDIQLMDEVQISRALLFAEILAPWHQALKKYVHGRLEAGVEIPGWKLVRGRSGRRAWSNEQAAIAALRPKFGGEIFTDPVLLSPAQLEKKIPTIDKKLIASLVTVPEGSPTVAPESDKRPALAPSAVRDFPDEGEEDFLE